MFPAVESSGGFSQSSLFWNVVITVSYDVYDTTPAQTKIYKCVQWFLGNNPHTNTHQGVLYERIHPNLKTYTAY